MDAPAFFIPDRDPPTFYPLRSFLRPPPASVTEKYIAAFTAPGDLVIDPFASTPTLARVAQRMGRRAIAVQSNPLWSWLARAMATLPPATAINAALARLGDVLKDAVPLRTHISELYATLCAACHQVTPADYFVHARGAGPIQRHYTCLHCGETRDDPATEDDLKRAAAFDARGFHYHFAFERVAPVDNLHVERIRKILDVYPPRNLYALVTLTVKIDTLFHATRERDLLLLLLLHLLDRGTSFYAEPSLDALAQPTAHKQFVEFNLWRELEIAAHALGRAASEPAVDLTDSAVDVLDAERPRVFMSRGSTQTLARVIPEHTVTLVLTAPPTRRLAVWALSYFWGAWILGRAAVDSLIPFLDPHKTDPTWERRWYFDSLVASMDAIAKLLRLEAHAVFVFNESWPAAIEALLLAAAGARLELETFLFQPRLGDFPRREFDGLRGDYRITFARRDSASPKISLESELAEKIRTAALAGGRDLLTRRGEPLAYSWVHHAAYTRVAREGYLAQVMGARIKATPSRFVFNAVRDGLSQGYAHDLDHYESSLQFLWLRRGQLDPPLIDRVDDAVREYLQASGGALSREELEDAIYRQFAGDLTPEAGLIELCAQAYADARDVTDPAIPSGGVWHRRTENVAEEKARARAVLTRLGGRLEYRVAQIAPFDLTWELGGNIAHGFVWRDRARFDDLARIHIAPARGYLVVPETQVSLLREKARRAPHLADAFNEAGWDFVRVPFAEKLLQEEKIERRDVMLMAGLVPPVAEERAQLELF
jgi:hypothetical protein